MNPLINNNQGMPNIGQMFGDFRKNPLEFLAKNRFNIPQNVGNNPQDIIQHLLNSGQISQQTLNQAQAMYNRMR